MVDYDRVMVYHDMALFDRPLYKGKNVYKKSVYYTHIGPISLHTHIAYAQEEEKS